MNSLAAKVGCTAQTPRKASAYDVEYATLEWVDWFNNLRLLEPIGNIPPVELEMAYYRQLERSALVA